mmetsp:Transcript_22612/g.33472  ORF Transcript_22612/g.33472 Transcript_22612/m.33472 type:complete len:236 (-) Transcript_22612:92-799(-)
MQSKDMIRYLYLLFSISLLLPKGTRSFSPISISTRCPSSHVSASASNSSSRKHTRRISANLPNFSPSESLIPTEKEEIAKLIKKCAADRSISSKDIILLLEDLAHQKSTVSQTATQSFIDRNLVEGKFELVFSSAVAGIPFFGKILDGYMPNREIITFDFDSKEMSLVVELLPFLPTIDIYGTGLKWAEENAVLEYTVKGKEKASPSQWDILFADDDVVAARSSVTGLNVIRRLS